MTTRSGDVRVWDPLVIVHVAGVVVACLLHGESLVRAMATGRK